MNDARSRALLATALHPSSSPNERLMALSALNRIMDRAGVHASDIAIYDASEENGARNPAGSDEMREGARREAELAALTRRAKAQDAALRKAAREVADKDRELATLRATIARRESAADEDACQIAALETDLAARDRMIASLQARLAAEART